MITILIVEDNSSIRENVVEMLELEGYNVYAALDGFMGLQIATDIIPDLILCDVMMPELNGHELFDKLKKNPSTNNIPFVFMTSSVENKEIELALSKGADGYIKKPFDDKEFFDTIEQCLGLQKKTLSS